MRLPIFFLVITIFSCSKSREPCIDDPIIAERLSVEIERLEDNLFEANSAEEILTFLKNHPMLAREFLGADQYPSDSILAREIFRVIKNPYTDTLLNETKKYFADMTDLKAEFEQAFSYIHHYYPEFKVPKIQTLVTGFGSSEMYVDDDRIIIGLEFYLGEKAKYRPQGIPLYILQRYDKPYIVPAAILLYAEQFLRENHSDNSMAADMIYYGKKYFFAKNMLPCTPDSLLIWYDGKELANVEKNRKLLWYYFLENELLYETNHIVKQKYLDERPNIFEIGNDCPGRIGAWIGWDIVRSYNNKNKEVSLQEIMANPDAQDILNQAKYNPF
jgi:hypothetical protein